MISLVHLPVLLLVHLLLNKGHYSVKEKEVDAMSEQTISQLVNTTRSRQGVGLVLSNMLRTAYIPVQTEPRNL